MNHVWWYDGAATSARHYRTIHFISLWSLSQHKIIKKNKLAHILDSCCAIEHVRARAHTAEMQCSIVAFCLWCTFEGLSSACIAAGVLIHIHRGIGKQWHQLMTNGKNEDEKKIDVCERNSSDFHICGAHT